MPATSRSGERLRRRSASGRAGSPSKSRIDPAAGGEQGLAEVVVAVVRITRPADAGVRQRAQALAHVLAAAGDRRDGLASSGRSTEDALDLLVDRSR